MDADQYQLLLRQFPALALGVYHHESYPKKAGRRSDSHVFPPALFASGHGIFMVHDRRNFDALVCTLTLKIIEEQDWQPMIDELWLNRTVEDFDETRVSRERIDSYRKWHHTRTNVGTPVSMEQMQEDCEDGTKDIADPNGEFEHEVLNELRLKSFMGTCRSATARF